MKRVIVWFSNGAASTIAWEQVITQAYDLCYEIIAVYCDTSSDEHPDNARFQKEVKEWLGLDLMIIGSNKYDNIEDVAESTKYMAGVKGARCTVELKKVPRFNFQRPDDIHIFGFTADEIKRAVSFKNNNPDMLLCWPLIDAGITKDDCYRRLQAIGIKLPVMYRLGYNNNNCIGCFKATSAEYWNKIRVDFPDVFERRCVQSRKLGVKLTRFKGVRVFLDELPSDYLVGRSITEDLSCGPQCGEQT